MNTGENLFRSAVVGGFNREDVTAYLEKMSTAHNEELGMFRQQLETAEAAKAAAETAAQNQEETVQRQERRIAELTEALEAVKRERDSLKATGEQQEKELSEVNALKAQVTVLAELQRALAQKKEALARAEDELTILRGEREGLREDAAAYHSIKDRLSTIELEAHQRAQEAEDAAAVHVTQMQSQVKAWLRDMHRAYDAWRADVEDSVGRSQRELSGLLSGLEGVTERLASGEAALDGFAEFYQTLTEAKEGNEP